jgi:hypothetical protein
VNHLPAFDLLSTGFRKENHPLSFAQAPAHRQALHPLPAMDLHGSRVRRSSGAEKMVRKKADIGEPRKNIYPLYLVEI